MRLVRNCAFVRQLADRTRAVIVGPVLQEPALESTKGHGHRRPNVVGVPYPRESPLESTPSQNALPKWNISDAPVPASGIPVVHANRGACEGVLKDHRLVLSQPAAEKLEDRRVPLRHARGGHLPGARTDEAQSVALHRSGAIRKDVGPRVCGGNGCVGDQ